MADIRVERTKGMLCDALEELTREKPLSDISVSEICERSTVRRGTFYRHFEDKSAFVRYYLTTMTSRFMADLSADNDLSDLRTYASKMHSTMLDFNTKNSEMSKHILQQNLDMQTFDMMVYQIADGIIERIKARAEQNGTPLPASPKFIGTFYAAGLVSTMHQWIRDPHRRSKDELADDCTELLMRMVG